MYKRGVSSTVMPCRHPTTDSTLSLKTLSDCNFINLSSILIIFGILVNTDICDMPHDFGCHGNHLSNVLPKYVFY